MSITIPSYINSNINLNFYIFDNQYNCYLYYYISSNTISIYYTSTPSLSSELILSNNTSGYWITPYDFVFLSENIDVFINHIDYNKNIYTRINFKLNSQDISIYNSDAYNIENIYTPSLLVFSGSTNILFNIPSFLPTYNGINSTFIISMNSNNIFYTIVGNYIFIKNNSIYSGSNHNIYNDIIKYSGIWVNSTQYYYINETNAYGFTFTNSSYNVLMYNISISTSQIENLFDNVNLSNNIFNILNNSIFYPPSPTPPRKIYQFLHLNHFHNLYKFQNKIKK